MAACSQVCVVAELRGPCCPLACSIGAIILVGVCDLCAIWIVMAANKAEFTLWRWRWRNFLYSQWVERYAYKIHVVVAGLVTLVMSVVRRHLKSF